MTASQNEHQARLIAIVSAIPWLMDALALVRDMSLSRWCIGAGAIRNTVWAHLLGSGGEALPEGDVDVAYFDPACTDTIRDAQIRGELEKARPGLHWDVVNQAGVHRWYEAEFGEPHAPFASLEEAVGSWPERATCIGVSLAHDGSLQVIAPLGLSDLFGLVIARNPQVSETVYRRRLADKRFDERWPEVTVLL